MEISKVKCPKCKSKDLYLNELWKDHGIQWEQADGVIVLSSGVLSEGNPYKVEGQCQRCQHRWTLKGIIQIHGVIKD